MKGYPVSAAHIAQIRARRREGVLLKVIAADFGIDMKTASRICRGTSPPRSKFRTDGLPHRILTHLATHGEMRYADGVALFGVSLKFMHDTVARMVALEAVESVHVIRLPKAAGK